MPNDNLTTWPGFEDAALSCIQCGRSGELVWHADEQMHEECIEAFEALTDNAVPVAVEDDRTTPIPGYEPMALVVGERRR